MKKIVKLWLVLVLVLGLSINVYAVEGDVLKVDETNEQTDGNTTDKETEEKEKDETTSGGDTTGGTSDKEGQEGSTGSETTKPEDNKPSTSSKSDKAELISITINDNIKVQCDSKETCEVSNDAINTTVNKVKIKYEISDKATIKTDSSDNKALTNNEESRNLDNIKNEYKVFVTAEAGNTKEYTIVITKKVLDTDTTLKSLIVNGEEVALKTGDTVYNATVSYTAKKIEISVTPGSSKSYIEKNDKGKTAKLSYDFTDDTKKIQIKVFSEAGDSKTYTINVARRPEEDATLKDITIENYELDFNKDTTDYEISVLKDVEKLEIKATPTDVDAEVKIEGNENLQIGENKITITVTNDGTIKTYTIKVNKLDEEDKSLANLESLTIKGYDLDFKEDKYEYDLEIGDDNTLDIDYKTKSPDATVQVTGNMDLVNGSIVKVRVTYTSGLTNVYRINIIKEEVKEPKKNNTVTIIIIIAIILILIAVALLVVILIKNKKNKNKPNDKDKGEVNKIDNTQEEVQNPGNPSIEKIMTANPNDVISMPPDDIEDII